MTISIPGLVLLAAVGLWAGIQNALAGGGSFLTFPALLLAGVNPLGANITSAVALFPGQVATGLAGWRHVSGAGRLSFLVLAIVSLAGGAAGAWLLLATPASVFAIMVPWLVLFATAVFAWGSFRRPSAELAARLPPAAAGAIQTGISIYGGYFGGGIGFMMMAILSLAGLDVRHAGATKNLLAGIINAAAVVLFAFSPAVNWPAAAAIGAGALGGGQIGAWMLRRVNERALRIAIVVLGLLLFVGLLWRQYH